MGLRYRERSEGGRLCAEVSRGKSFEGHGEVTENEDWGAELCWCILGENDLR